MNTNKDIILSTGKKCPKCGCDSLEEGYSKETVKFQKNFICVANCGMQFGLNRQEHEKIKIFFNKKNESYLRARFNIQTHNEEIDKGLEI